MAKREKLVEQIKKNIKDGVAIIPIDLSDINQEEFAAIEELRMLVISDGIKSIAECAFVYCLSLGSVVIAQSVEHIGKEAFLCCKSLRKIIYCGTIEQWKKIRLDEAWNAEIPAKEVHCSDGVLPITPVQYFMFFENDDEFTSFCIDRYDIQQSPNAVSYVQAKYTQMYVDAVDQGIVFVIKDPKSSVVKRGTVAEGWKVKNVVEYPSLSDDVIMQLDALVRERMIMIQ